MHWTLKYKDSDPVIQECIFKKKPFSIPDKISNETVKKAIQEATVIDTTKKADITRIKEILSTL